MVGSFFPRKFVAPMWLLLSPFSDLYKMSSSWETHLPCPPPKVRACNFSREREKRNLLSVIVEIMVQGLGRWWLSRKTTCCASMGTWVTRGHPCMKAWVTRGHPCMGTWVTRRHPCMGTWVTRGHPCMGTWVTGEHPCMRTWVTRGHPCMGTWVTMGHPCKSNGGVCMWSQPWLGVGWRQADPEACLLV